MVKQSLLLMMLSLFSLASWAVDFHSTVDRTEVSEGESIILTVRYNANVLTGSPDFSPLEQQFQVLNQQRKSSFQVMNGRSESWTIWTLSLIPKRKGNLVIPSLSFKGENSKAIQIQVHKQSAQLKDQQQDVFFLTETDVTSSYVQGQVVYSEKLYFAVELDNSQFSEVKVDEAVVEPLGQINRYQTQLNGRLFNVYERRYVIFPQVSGEMVIPGPRYHGEISFGPWRPGRPISVTRPPIKLNVLPKPAHYPQASWLPAQLLELDYKWQGKITDLKVGEPVTLEISVSAHGLSSAQLPAIPLPDVEGLKYYPDQAQNKDSQTNGGVIGSRSQSIAIVPTQAGSLTLPEIRLPWWNTRLARTETAVIPAQRLTAFSTQSNQAPAPPLTQQPLGESSTSLAPVQISDPQAEANPFWQYTSAILLLVWLATLALWWQRHNGTASELSQQNAQDKPVSQGQLKHIKQACRNNDAVAARLALLAWGRQAFHPSLTGLDALQDYIQDESLRQAINELDQTLYGAQASIAWQGEFLWQLLKTQKWQSSETTAQLNPLYPSESSIKVNP